MLNLLIALAAGVAMAWFCALGLPGGWWLGSFIGLAFFVVVFVLISRRLSKKLEPIFSQVQRQAQAGQTQQAIESLESLLPYGRWQIMLAGTVRAQIGMLHVGEGNEDKAISFLESASPRIPEARAFLASIYYRNDDAARALSTLEIAIKFNKKNAFIFNFYAWLLNKEGQEREALRVLQLSLKGAPGNEVTLGNISRLQNDQRMNMKDFGMSWYSLKIENPPASMGMVQQARKGFRQPPKAKSQNKGQRKRRR